MKMSNFCSGTAELLQIVGWVLTIFKIAIPLLIIAFGIFDFGKAVTAAKDDEIKKSAKSLMWRAVAGIVIFFIPSIVIWVFDALNNFRESSSSIDFETCKACILTPWSGCDGDSGNTSDVKSKIQKIKEKQRENKARNEARK